MSVLTNLGHENQKSYTLFETTPLSWGSPVVGRKPHHSDDEVNGTSKLSLGTCMQVVPRKVYIREL